jgi:hypothetical protein
MGTSGLRCACGGSRSHLSLSLAGCSLCCPSSSSSEPLAFLGLRPGLTRAGHLQKAFPKAFLFRVKAGASVMPAEQSASSRPWGLGGPQVVGTLKNKEPGPWLHFLSRPTLTDQLQTWTPRNPLSPPRPPDWPSPSQKGLHIGTHYNWADQEQGQGFAPEGCCWGRVGDGGGKR